MPRRTPPRVYDVRMVRIEVLLFASLRDRAGTDRLRLELGNGARVETALDAVVERLPALRAALPSLRCAVNEEFAAADRRLETGDTLALIPPVSGG
jgi:molybdopterin synthase catalytic subunit